jgi:phosphoribosylformimino-5-aminoimidazole carboxamide ribonucleotide (ProFAR) isomerase
MLARFADFPQIQVIDLDAAIGSGANDELVEWLAERAVTRVGGGVRTVDRARGLVSRGAHKVIIGTAAFSGDGVIRPGSRWWAPPGAAVVVALDSRAAASSSRAGANRPTSRPRR